MIVMNDFKKEYQAHAVTVDKAIKRCLESGHYILGKETELFEEAFAAFTGATYCIGVANGLEALQIALMALGIGEGDEVLTVSNSAVATSLAITNVGATPVFVDVDEYYHMDPALIESHITKRTKAIMPVHLFGQSIAMSEIQKIAQKHGLAIVEDACQAHGARFNNQQVGTFGALAAFSFYPTKNLGAYGDGGAITTNSKELYEKCKMLRNYGQQTRYFHILKGINSRLDEVQSAILSAKLPKLPEALEKRNEIAQAYLEGLKNIPGIVLPKIRPEAYHSFHLFVIKVKDREELMTYLSEKGVQTIIHYPVPIHKQECYAEYNSITLPVTEQNAKEMLSLPIHPFMSAEEVQTVINTLQAYYEGQVK